MSMKMFSDISTLREEIGERKNENSEENSCAIGGKFEYSLLECLGHEIYPTN